IDLEWSDLQEQAGFREEAHKSLRHATELLESQVNDAHVDDALRQEAAKVHSRLGRISAVSGRWDEAVAAFRKAVELDPQSVLAWQNLGWVQYRTGNSKASLEALETSCKLQNQ